MKTLKRGEYLGSTLATRQAGCLLVTLCSYRPDTSFGYHVHEHPGFFFLLNGDHREERESSSFDQQPLTPLFHGISDSHQTDVGPSGMRGVNISIDRQWWDEQEFAGNIGHGQYSPQSNLLSLRLIASTLIRNLPEETLEMQVADLMADLSPSSENGIPSWLSRARCYLIEECHTSVSLREIAYRSCVSPVHFARCFRRAYGTSVSEFLHKARLARAMRRISDNTGNIASAAVASGFSDQSHMSRLCRRHIDATPSEVMSLMRMTQSF